MKTTLNQYEYYASKTKKPGGITEKFVKISIYIIEHYLHNIIHNDIPKILYTENAKTGVKKKQGFLPENLINYLEKLFSKF